MKPIIFILALCLVPFTSRAEVGANQQVLLETQLQERVFHIVQKADKSAIVQVKVDIRRLSATLPGVWSEATSVTPVTADGSLAGEGIEAIHVRVLSQIPEMPSWIQEEVKKSLVFDKVKVDTKFEKAKGKVSEDSKMDSTVETIKSVGKDIAEGLSKSGSGETGKQISSALWGLVGGLVITMILLCGAIFILGRKIESAFFRVVDEKLAPLVQAQAAAAGRRPGRDLDSQGSSTAAAVAQQAARSSAGASTDSNEFSDLSDASIFAIVMDCYWTHSDAYANFIWTKLSAKQRDALLGHKEFGAELFRYFQFARQFPAENLGYHQDVQYVDANSTFTKVDQKDLAKYIAANPVQAVSLTPLRWDQLPISLSDRLKATLAMNSSAAKPSVAAPLKASALRPLPRRLEVKTLSADDETYLWSNSTAVHADLRASLKTLVWLALCPQDVREAALGDIDARDLAEAWVGPEPVLEKLKEAIPAKKYEMVQHFLKDSTPDRNSPVFEHLVALGAQELKTPSSIKSAAA